MLITPFGYGTAVTLPSILSTAVAVTLPPNLQELQSELFTHLSTTAVTPRL